MAKSLASKAGLGIHPGLETPKIQTFALDNMRDLYKLMVAKNEKLIVSSTLEWWRKNQTQWHAVNPHIDQAHIDSEVRSQLESSHFIT